MQRTDINMEFNEREGEREENLFSLYFFGFGIKHLQHFFYNNWLVYYLFKLWSLFVMRQTDIITNKLAELQKFDPMLESILRILNYHARSHLYCILLLLCKIGNRNLHVSVIFKSYAADLSKQRPQEWIDHWKFKSLLIQYYALNCHLLILIGQYAANGKHSRNCLFSLGFYHTRSGKKSVQCNIQKREKKVHWILSILSFVNRHIQEAFYFGNIQTLST